jgi:aromatic-L-amino-acid decarboxylase
VDKAAITLGFGHENVVHIDTDADFRMRVDALDAAVRCGSSPRGYLPLATVATVGTTSTTSIDPVPAIAALCAREGMWLHVDGSYGGVAAVVPEMRHVLAGVELADSLVVNPHKWLFTPDRPVGDVHAPSRRAQARVLARAEYLVTREQSEVVNLMDYGVPARPAVSGAQAVDGHSCVRCGRAGGSSPAADGDGAGLRRLGGRCCRMGAGGAGALLARVLSAMPLAGTSEAEREALNAAILERVNASGRATCHTPS